MQQLFPLSNGGQLKVTIAHWRTAEGVLLDGQGITPDTILAPTVEDITKGYDGQLEKTLSSITHALSTQK